MATDNYSGDYNTIMERVAPPLRLREYGSAGPGKPAYPSDDRPSAAKRGYGHGWRKERAAYLANHPYCEVPECDADSHSVHHKHAVKDGGPDHIDNYYAVCAAHHNKIEKGKPTQESINEAAWDQRGSDIGVVYHGSNEFIKTIDRSRLQSRDAGFYGRGFYVSQSRTGARFYGGRISTFAVDPNATVLQGSLLPAKAPPGLVDEVIRYKYDKAIDRARARGKEDALADELEYIRTSPTSWSQALNDYANGMGYDIAAFAPGEMVVKNIEVLTRVPTPRESIEEQGDHRPEWTEDSHAYPDAPQFPYAKDWVRRSARANKIRNATVMGATYYSDTHVAVHDTAPNQRVRLFLQEALGRGVEAYREGWLVTPQEADWLGFRRKGGNEYVEYWGETPDGLIDWFTMGDLIKGATTLPESYDRRSR